MYELRIVQTSGQFTDAYGQHYDFYYFIVNKTKGPTGALLFPYSAQPPRESIADAMQPKAEIDLATYDPLARPSTQTPPAGTADLEGESEDPTITKVVDRRWYERNKHIFPASAWEEFEPSKDYSSSARRDAEGNAYFFS